MHDAAYRWVAQAVAHHGRLEGLVVEIGGKDVNGSVRPLFGEPYIAVDVRPGPGVDVVADGATYQPPTQAALVVCCEVLEHTADGAAICRNAYDMLRPGGRFIVTAAGDGRIPHSAEDGGPLRDGEYYRNVSVDTLRGWLEPFAQTDIRTHAIAGDIYAVAEKGWIAR